MYIEQRDLDTISYYQEAVAWTLKAKKIMLEIFLQTKMLQAEQIEDTARAIMS